MAKRMLIDALHSEEMRVVISDDRQIFDFDFTSAQKKQMKGNIYLAKITRVEPSLQAAFVEYGGGKQGFLPFAEIHPDYYQIPMSDRQRLMEEAANEDPAQNDAAETAQASDNQTAAADGGEAAQLDDEPAAADEDSAIPDSAGVETLTALPAAIEAIPEYKESEASVEEPAPPAMPERTVGFATSEIVASDQYEHEELAGRLSQLDTPESPDAPEAKEEGVETLANEDEEISAARPRRNYYRRYKIQEVIKRGQVVLVQVIKEERGNKGVSLTTFLSLAGRYCVLMPNSPKDGGVSRKISDGETRKRLKEIMAELRLGGGMSVIIRTAGIDRTHAEIRRDFDYLVKLWNQIREDTLGSTAPALIYEEGDLIKRSIRDQYTNDINEVIVQGKEAFESARDFMKMLLPSHTPRVKNYRESMPLFYAYGVEDQLLSMHDQVVKLKSGGYLVINPTEALISIDVNSGRSTGERNIEETAAKTNLEAAAEVARQLRLRDLAGLIVIDFIDMMESRNRRAVERALKDALKSDRAKIQLGRISPFGLLEMSRQRLRSSISETNNVQCPHCSGRGVIRSNESMSIQIVRALEKEAATGQWQTLKLNAPEHTALHLLNTKRKLLENIEERYGVTITVCIDHSLTASAYTVEKARRSGGRATQSEAQPQEAAPRRERGERGRRGGRGRGRDRDRDDTAIEAADNESELEASDETPESTGLTDNDSGDDEGNQRRRAGRRRGRRGGRGRRRDGEGFAENEGGESGDEISGNVEAAPYDEANDADGNIATDTSADSNENSERPQRSKRGSSRVRSRNDRGERPERPERGQRGGRRRWKGEEGAEGDAPTSAGNALNGDNASLPAFTREPVERVAPKAPELIVTHSPQQHEAMVGQPVPITERPEGTPARKGWWQRMIELD